MCIRDRRNSIDVLLKSSNDNDIQLKQKDSYGGSIDIDFAKTDHSFVAALQTGWANTATINSTNGSYDAFIVKQDGEGNYAVSVVD